MAEKKAKKGKEVEVKPEEVVETPVVATEAEEVETSEAEATEKHEVKTTKAGKRSEKAAKEAEVKAEKAERKAKGDTTPQGEAEAKVKQAVKPARSRLERRGKNYRKVAELIEKGKVYSLKDAMDLAVKTSVGKFDATVELHLNLNVDPKLADQNIRGTVSLPNGTGKTVRVAAFVGTEQVEAAKKAGADIAGEDDFLALLDKEQIDFDILVSTPQLMPKLGKYARLLGPKGLMPNPKSGTVTTNIAQAVKEAKGGKVEYRVDKQSIIHQGVGKVSFGTDKLYENAKAFIDNLNAGKPASVKGALVKNITASTTMGPGIKVETSSL
jgi:large subunit ribosomal protein L1